MKLYCFLVLLLAVLFTGSGYAQPKDVVIGYVGGYKGLAHTDRINAKKLTHINYAFVNIRNNRAFLNREATDTVNLKNLVLLKEQNPALKILISIGGWSWSGKFSDAVLTDTARAGFAASAADIVSRFNLDGIDIDWEYPGISGDKGNIYRPEDKQNYTLMFKEIRKDLDKLSLVTKKNYLLTTAAGAFQSFVDHTDMAAVQQYLNFINLMTYDFSGGRIASHHTALYSSKSYEGHNSGDNAVAIFEKAGVPAAKLVLGIAFYGHTSILAAGDQILGDSVIKEGREYGYTALKDTVMKLPEYRVYRDKSANADYLFNKNSREFISFDDEWSVKQKCKYVNKQKLGGVMFWEYDSDLKGYLLSEINKDLK